jgi:hypothetical protein
MKTIERVKQHYQGQDRLVIAVPEWGEKDAPLQIHILPMTMAEASLIQRVAGKKASGIEKRRLFPDRQSPRCRRQPPVQNGR